MKRSTTLVLLALACAAAFPAQAASADGASLAHKGKPAKVVGTTTPPVLTYSLESDSRSEVEKLDPVSGDTKKLAASKVSLASAAWSATTSQVYYTLDSGEGEASQVETDSVPEAGGAPVHDVFGSNEFDISPDALTYVYSKNNQLFTVPAAGGTPTQLTGAGGGKPRFSPDGKKIVFTRIVGNNADVFVIDTAGTNLKRITAAGTFDFSGVFSPNGQRLLFTRESAAGDLSIYAVDLTGKNLRLVAKDAEDPDWAHNGWITYLAFDDNGTEQVAVLSPGVPGTESLVTDNGLDATAVRFRSGNAPVPQA